ncbi:GT2 family glycosyltransferase [Nocardioides luteus]|uniref:Glycosyl transferase n=1 Tax=Nocardioides luteus TaxID=1844 RepID=A0ABQ5SVY1_9ACTN|nr:glycosyltransferase [Nocardioides luteus]MDR7309244.1 GT2 family glycosyltransferase [Nocardioides luteus]GGR48828.1 glycosyl transferase [Nocardioides luteus]GLJ67649.1 glycosyl transferase [Nocardioides luteus]
MRRFHRPRPLSTRPSVSVVIPCYNYGRYLPQAVAGALDQSGVDVDVLIVDDASTDDSADIARSLAAADPRVQVLVHEQNAGHIRTYNDGLALARGDYVTLVSADDVLMPDALTRAAALMEHHRSVGLVYGYARSFTDELPTGPTRTRSWSVWAGRDWLATAARQGRCFLASPEAVMRREALEQTDGYDPRLPHSADFDMWLRTAVHWDVGRVDGPIQAAYRVHAANMHLTEYSGWLTDLRERRRTFDILFDERAPEVAEVQALKPYAMRALATEAMRRGREVAHGDSATVIDHLRFAAETHLAIRHTRAWSRAWAEAVEGRAPEPGPWARATGKVRHHLRWRFERRYGT